MYTRRTISGPRCPGSFNSPSRASTPPDAGEWLRRFEEDPEAAREALDQAQEALDILGAAGELGMGPFEVVGLIAAGKLRAIRYFGRLLVLAESIDRLAARARVE